MKPVAAAALAALWSAFPAGAEEDARRDLDAHEHGRGTLAIAVENDTIWMVLEVPGADIVGFEHAAESAADKAAVEAAIAVLNRPLALFAMPEAAGCTVAEAHAEIAGEEHHDEHDGEEDGAHEEEEDGEAHGEFHAEYMLACAAPGAIDSIGFAYFAAFPGATELDVTVVSDKGQNVFEVGRDAPAVRVADYF